HTSNRKLPSFPTRRSSDLFRDASGKPYNAGRYTLNSEVTLTPSDPASCAFALDDVTIGIGFHWERKERQVFRGALRIIKSDAGLDRKSTRLNSSHVAISYA